MQETRANRFDPAIQGLRAWLIKTVRNKAVDLLRRHRVRRAVSLDAAVAAGALPADERDDPASAIEANWQREIMGELLHMLRGQVSAENYQIFQWHSLESRPVAEIAGVLGISHKQVCDRHQRIRRRFNALAAVYRGDGFGAEVVNRLSINCLRQIIGAFPSKIHSETPRNWPELPAVS